MGWRILQITKPCKLSVKNRQLLYESQEGDSLKLPLEDMSVVILENRQILLSSSLLSELAEYDVVLFSCDASHLPSGTFFPYHNHSRYAEISWAQTEAGEPFKKRMWQEVVKAKINNQAAVLQALDLDGAKKLQEIAKQVQSGDTKNAEAYAANLYWKYLFEKFNRSDESDIRNSALNYGYAIVRGAMARAVVGAGLLPCFGIHHANKLNQFNLVDDLMEPFRAFVDYKVALMEWTEVKELTTELKNQLVSILTKNCFINDEEISLLYSCEIEAASVAKSFKTKNLRELRIPILKNLPLFE